MAKSFFPLKFSFYINLDNKERARSERQITTETNFVGRETLNYIAAVRKREMLAATNVKMSGSEKQSEQEHKHFLHKTRNK